MGDDWFRHLNSTSDMFRFVQMKYIRDAQPLREVEDLLVDALCHLIIKRLSCADENVRTCKFAHK